MLGLKRRRRAPTQTVSMFGYYVARATLGELEELEHRTALKMAADSELVRAAVVLAELRARVLAECERRAI